MSIETVFRELGAALVPEVARYRARLHELKISTKVDGTLLSEADTHVQRTILTIIKDYDPDAGIIAEEAHEFPARASLAGWTWVVDPIDGTKEFIDHQRTEFCTAVCALYDRQPVAALVIAYELGIGGTPLVIQAYRDKSRVLLNGDDAPLREPPEAGQPRNLSVTRSAGTEQPFVERRAIEYGCRVKIVATSQTLDLVRLALNLSEHSEQRLDSFDLFFRLDQKLWDGLPGLWIATLAGWEAVNIQGEPLLPLRTDHTGGSPSFQSTLVASRSHREWFQSIFSKSALQYGG